MGIHKLLPPFLVVMAASSVYTQTFQYSRGWTNGKRAGDGHKMGVNLENVLERVVDNPCQFAKLKYILEGRPVTEKIFMPCEYGSDDDPSLETHPRRPPFGKSGSQDPILENFL